MIFHILGLALLLLRVVALEVVPGSKCEPLCSDEAVGSLSQDASCLDAEYNSTPGSYVKNCITCQLNSTAVDPVTNVSDVEYALFNMRYTVAECMFGYPEERVSISSPCQVTCAPLQQAVTAYIPNNNSTNNFTVNQNYCTAGRFDDTTINNCAFCYSLIPQQLIMGNFMQALHIACYSPPIPGNTFYPDGRTIFNESTIAGPTGAKPTPSSGPSISGAKLILAIVLPIVGFLVILAGVCFCCWHFTRKRRQRMAASGRMSKFYDGHVAGAPSPKWREDATEMSRISAMPKSDGQHRRSPGLAQGRYVQHGESDEAGLPLNTTGPVRQDSHLHDQFIGATTTEYRQSGFLAQDGYVRGY